MNKKRPLGEVIRASRKAAGFSQRDLARIVGVTPSHIAFVEAGARRPSHSLLFRLARTLNLNRQNLFLLVYPEMAPFIFSQPPAETPAEAWRRFVAIAGRYSVTPKEMAVLRKVSQLGKISAPSSYFWILNSIRQSLEPD